MSAGPRPVLDDISVVIPTLGRPILQTCLRWMAAGNSWPTCIIIVDQSSSPEVDGWLDEFRALGIDIRHVPSMQRGRASGVNRGIERARTRFVAVTDDDCFVEPDWLQNMATHLRENSEAIITGRVEPEGDEEAVALMTSRTPAIYRRPRLKHDSMSGGNMGVGTAIIQRVGLLDEDPRLRSAEDCELSYRALRSGVPIIYAPDVALRHYGWRDPAQRAAQYQAYARSHGGFYGKYLRKGDWFIALRVVIHYARALRRWIRGTLSSDVDAALNGRAYVTGLLPGIIAGLRGSRT